MDLEYEWFKKKIREVTGVDLQSYRPDQMKRLVEKQVEKAGARSFVGLVKILENNPAAIQQFRNDVTINVSCLFRDYPRWEELGKHLPSLVERKKSHSSSRTSLPDIRIWSAGCSIGAEPYTTAVIMEELRRTEKATRFNYTIICSDIDRSMIDRAKEGIFSDREMKETPPDMKARYFDETPRPDRPWAERSTSNLFYKASPSLRTNLRFRVHNILEDGLEMGLDLIICRNVIIYFNTDVKENLFRRFNRSLAAGGILFIGATEVIFKPGEYGFSSLASGLYRKLNRDK